MEYHHHIAKVCHGWRDLAKEIGIIVIGVLIALGASQTVDWLHRRGEVSEARAALRGEIGRIARGATLNIQAERCLQGRLDQLMAWANGGARPPQFAGALISRPNTNIWQVAKTGAAAHMPLEEQASYALFYYGVEEVASNVEIERATWLRMAGLTAKPALTQAEAQRLLEVIEEARAVGRARIRSALGVVQRADAMGVKPQPTPDGREVMAQACGASSAVNAVTAGG